MLKICTGVFSALLFLAACTPPKLDGDPQTVRIEPPASGTAVIYLIRSTRDWSTNASLVFLGDERLGTTGAGVYYRIEVPPGRHRLTGYAFDQGNITIDAQPDRVYFVEQHVQGMFARAQVMHSSEFVTIDEARARELIANIHTMPGAEHGFVKALSTEPQGSVTVLPLIPLR